MERSERTERPERSGPAPSPFSPSAPVKASPSPVSGQGSTAFGPAPASSSASAQDSGAASKTGAPRGSNGPGSSPSDKKPEILEVSMPRSMMAGQPGSFTTGGPAVSGGGSGPVSVAPGFAGGVTTTTAAAAAAPSAPYIPTAPPAGGANRVQEQAERLPGRSGNFPDPSPDPRNYTRPTDPWTTGTAAPTHPGGTYSGRRPITSFVPTVPPPPQESNDMPAPTAAPPSAGAPGTYTRGGSASAAQPGVSEFRRNADRQSREQQSVGSLLSIVGFSLLFGLLLVAGLAGYGGYVLYEQIKENSATIATAERNLRAETDLLRGQIKVLERSQSEADRIAREQQEVLTKLTMKTDEILVAIRNDSRTRTKEISDIREEIKARTKEIMDARAETRKAQRDADELRDRVDKLSARPRVAPASAVTTP